MQLVGSKILAFSYSGDPVNTEYMQNQLDAISIIFSELEVEHVNENDSRLALYTKTPDRFPCIMMFKDGARKKVTHAKFSERDFVEWVVDNLG
jgi:hypothetical protein